MLVRRWPHLADAPPELVRALVEGAQARGWDADALLGHIARESGFRPDARSSASTATGLAQWTENTLRDLLGPPPSGSWAPIVRRWTWQEQLPLVWDFFERYGKGRQLADVDFRMVGYGLGPAPRDDLIFGDRSAEPRSPLGRVWRANSELDKDGDGLLTPRDVRAEWEAWKRAADRAGYIQTDYLDAAETSPGSAGLAQVAPRRHAGGGVVLLGALVFGVVIARRWKGRRA